MNKADLVNSISGKTGLTKTKSNEVIDAFLSSITESLSEGEKVTLVGFGTFSVSARSARQGRNPQTGDEIEISARRILTFKPSQVLKNAINNGS